MTKTFIPQDSDFIVQDTRQNRWAIPYHFDCLNARIENLLWHHKDAIIGKKILDIGCHMGTFAFAALEMGADHVLGIDSEGKLIEKANELFENHQVSKERYSFETGNAETFLDANAAGSFDTVLCLGILYYVPDPYRLLAKMKPIARDAILLDTFTAAYAGVQGKDADLIRANLTDELLNLPLALFSQTRSQKKDYRIPQSYPTAREDLSMATYPTKALLELWFESLGFDFQRLDWAGYMKEPCHWRDLVSSEQKKRSHWSAVYSSGIRVSYRLFHSK